MKITILTLLLMPLLASSQLSVAKIFSDNMVLQREAPIRVWGKAIPGRIVAVTIGEQATKTTVQKDSSWTVAFKGQKANAKPQTLLIACGKERIGLHNILVGDIWLCSGQSNMEWPMIKEMHWKEEIKNANQPLIRFNNPPPAGRYVYGVRYTDSLNKRLQPNDFHQWSSWQNCDSNTLKEMSAVAYYFARSIVIKEGIPIGLVNLSIGGAPAETFISRQSLQNDKRFASKVKGDWLENTSLPQWVRQRGKENVGSNVGGYGDDAGLNHAYKPGFAYESGIRPLRSLGIKGVIWYQGESNSLEKERVLEYRDLLHVLIDDYRKTFRQPQLPFYWVQLSSIDTAHYASAYWPEFRDEQRRLLDEVTNGGMAVCSDLGFRNDVHPTNKKVVGERLARWALCNTYHAAVVPSGPLPLQATYSPGKVIVNFRYGRKLHTADGLAVRGFSLNGQHEVEATIENNRIVIATPNAPQFVYYGWKPFTDANLVNDEALPASTFKIAVKSGNPR